MITRYAPLPTWFDRVAADWFGPTATPAVSRGPRVAARPTEAGLELRVELPGVAEQDITLGVEGRVLTITAGRTDDGQRWSASRKLSIGESYDLDAVRAHYANGLLTVVVPTVRPVARTIAITPAPEPAAVETPAVETPAVQATPAADADTPVA